MKRILGFLALFVLLGIFVWTIVFLYRKSQATPVVFETETPVVTDIVMKTVATGAIVPRKEVEIKSRVSGIVEELHVEPGEYVKEGALIARIKIVPNMVAVNNAEAAVNAARISFENAEKELARARTLFEKGIISDTEMSQQKLAYELRKQELSAAESNLQLVKEGASRKSGKVSNLVHSTVEGMVLEVPVKEGASVIESNTFNAGTTIATIADMNDMIFQGKVDESEVGKLKEGMPLDIKIGAIDEQIFRGTLEYISPKGVSEQGAIQFEVKAAIEKKEGAFIRANYSANADIVLDWRDDVLAIREALLQFDEEGKPYVEVETGPQTFEKRPVEVGLSDGIHIEVKEGVSPSDRIKKPRAVTEAPKGRRG